MSKMFERIKIVLTDAQAIEAGDNLAEKKVAYDALEAEMNAKKDEHKDVIDGYKARLEVLGADVSEKASWLNERIEVKEIEVREEHDDGRKTVVVIRVDNGQQLRTRPMTLQEMAEAAKRMQGELSFDQEVDDDGAPEGEHEGEFVEAASEHDATAELNGQPLVNARKGRRGRKGESAQEAE
jgi:hypothetical protein